MTWPRRVRAASVSAAVGSLLLTTLVGGVMLGAGIWSSSERSYAGIPGLVLFFVLQGWQSSALRRLGTELGEERENEP